MVENNKESCVYPDCPPSELLKDMSKDIKDILKTVNKQELISNNVTHLLDSVKEIKTNNRSDFDNIYGRLRLLEIGTITKNDKKSMDNRIHNVEAIAIKKSDLIVMIALIGVIFAAITFIINVAVK